MSTSGLKEREIIEIRGELTVKKREIIVQEILTSDFAAEVAKNAENDTRWMPRGERRIVTKKAGNSQPFEIYLLVEIPKVLTVSYTGKDYGDSSVSPDTTREYKLCMPPTLYIWTFSGAQFVGGYAYGLDNYSPALFSTPDEDIRLYATPMPNIHGKGEAHLCMGNGFKMDLALPTIVKVQKCMQHWFTSPWNADLEPSFGRPGSAEAPTLVSLKHWNDLTVTHGDKAWNHYKMRPLGAHSNLRHLVQNLKGGNE